MPKADPLHARVRNPGSFVSVELDGNERESSFIEKLIKCLPLAELLHAEDIHHMTAMDYAVMDHGTCLEA